MMDYKTVVLLVILVALILLTTLTPVGIANVNGDSMEPTLYKGDLFLVLPSDDYEVGDIIVFKSEKNRRLVTHRIVEEKEEGYITKGDNNPKPDQSLLGFKPVTNKKIVGEAFSFNGKILHLPRVGVIITWMRQNIFSSVIIIFSLLTMIEYYYSKKEERS